MNIFDKHFSPATELIHFLFFLSGEYIFKCRSSLRWVYAFPRCFLTCSRRPGGCGGVGSRAPGRGGTRELYSSWTRFEGYKFKVRRKIDPSKFLPEKSKSFSRQDQAFLVASMDKVSPCPRGHSPRPENLENHYEFQTLRPPLESFTLCHCLSRKIKSL